jgi:hypothetical protein
VSSNCGGVSNTYSIPITNTWPATAATVFTTPTPIDFTNATGSNCYVGFGFQGATTADMVQVGYVDFAPYAENIRANTITVNNIIAPPGTTGGGPTGCAQSPVTGISGGFTCPTKGWGSSLSAGQGSGDTTITLTGSLSGLSPAGCFYVDAEYECYTGISGSILTGLTRGAYTTTPTTHSNGAQATSVDLVLGSIQQPPANMIAGGATSSTILSVNNGFPNAHGGASVMGINAGNNETWFNGQGAINQVNSSAYNIFEGNMQVGTSPQEPLITESGYLLQTNGPNSAYYPMTLGGGHAGSLNVIATPTITAPTINNYAGTGSTTISYVCSGTDFDGNLINGTTATISNGPSTWAFPLFIQVICPYVAGVNTYQIYRMVGGVNQGLVSSGTGPGYGFPDFNGSSSGGTPPVSNTSNPHISVAGSGNPVITMGSTTITSAAGAPSTTCGTAPNGSGSLWMRTDGGASTSLYSCAGTTWTAVTVP